VFQKRLQAMLLIYLIRLWTKNNSITIKGYSYFIRFFFDIEIIAWGYTKAGCCSSS